MVKLRLQNASHVISNKTNFILEIPTQASHIICPQVSVVVSASCML